MLETVDRVAIHELLALYGHLVDEKRWDELHLVFTEDATFDFTDFGNGTTSSLEDLITLWTSEAADHPLAHHASNVVITEGLGAAVEVLSKGIAVGTNGRVSSITYRDVVVRTPFGWRMAARTATRRR
jgi:SnoaL-like domain